MANFPTNFSSELVPLAEFDLSDRGHTAVANLHSRGLDIVSGITESCLGGILEIAETDAVKEFCPNDSKRFSDPLKWLSKGRGAFMLLDAESRDLVGYSWSGIEECEELPDNPTTTAFRTTIPGTGTDLVIATVEGARAVHGASDFGLETWASNSKAVKIYPRAGAQLVTAKSHEFDKELGEIARVKRPTLTEDEGTFYRGDQLYRHDTRLFMAFPEPQLLHGGTELVVA